MDSKLVAVIACTRPEMVGAMIESLWDCDEVRVGFDPTRRGQAKTLNSLLSGVGDDDVVRICDDDDLARNSRLLWQEFSTQADALLFSYKIGPRVVTVPDDPSLASFDWVIACNWMVRGRLLRKLGGQLMPEDKAVNTGTWSWLRVLDAVPADRIQVEPAIVGYQYLPREGTTHVEGWRDAALFKELERRADGNPLALHALERRRARRTLVGGE